MTLLAAAQQLTESLSTIYDGREAANIADWVMEHLTGYKKIDRVIHKEDELGSEKQLLLDKYTQELLEHKPVQYILHEAWFCGMKLFVDKNVLIPRPETEELVEWIVSSPQPQLMNKLLDVGTGSGCIPIAIKKKLPHIWTYACDISKKALHVAHRNAQEQGVTIAPIQLDFLDKKAREALPQVDILVSNPPYVLQKDKDTMSQNVLDYEPHLALFVQDNDPLIFYRALAEFAQTHLSAGGAIYVEIHEDLASGVQELFKAHEFTEVEIKKDMQGKDRMIKAQR
jgi:release factor glutamine methyltransferase